jgi:hypothetical protein
MAMPAAARMRGPRGPSGVTATADPCAICCAMPRKAVVLPRELEP